MAGTASELCDYNENKPCNLNRFDFFSLWLLKTAAASRLAGAGLCKGLPMLKVVESSVSIHEVSTRLSTESGSID